MKNVEFEIDGERYSLSEKGRYSNGRIALQVYSEDGPYMTLTINFPDSPEPEEGYFYAKYWSENKEFFMKMRRNGVIDFHPKEKESIHMGTKLLHRSDPFLVKISDKYLAED